MQLEIILLNEQASRRKNNVLIFCHLWFLDFYINPEKYVSVGDNKAEEKPSTELRGVKKGESWAVQVCVWLVLNTSVPWGSQGEAA